MSNLVPEPIFIVYLYPIFEGRKWKVSKLYFEGLILFLSPGIASWVITIIGSSDSPCYVFSLGLPQYSALTRPLEYFIMPWLHPTHEPIKSVQACDINEQQ